MFKVVAHFLDGRLVKGESFDILPNRPTCLIHTPDGQSVTVKLSELKGLFLVRELAGKRDYEDRRTVDPNDRRGRGARWLEIRFRDGEVLTGLSTHYTDELPVFVVVPSDDKSNNTRILINRAAVQGVRILQPA